MRTRRQNLGKWTCQQYKLNARFDPTTESHTEPLTSRCRDMRPWYPQDISCTRKHLRGRGLRICIFPSHGYTIRRPSTRRAHRAPCRPRWTRNKCRKCVSFDDAGVGIFHQASRGLLTKLAAPLRIKLSVGARILPFHEQGERKEVMLAMRATIPYAKERQVQRDASGQTERWRYTRTNLG